MGKTETKIITTKTKLTTTFPFILSPSMLFSYLAWKNLFEHLTVDPIGLFKICETKFQPLQGIYISDLEGFYVEPQSAKAIFARDCACFEERLSFSIFGLDQI
jgi:hypothetical protein